MPSIGEDVQLLDFSYTTGGVHICVLKYYKNQKSKKLYM